MFLTKKIIRPTLALLVLFSNNLQAQEYTNYPQPPISFRIPSSCRMELPAQNTLTGYLGERYQDNLRKRLLQIDEKGILQGFLHRPGAQLWIGEHVGKYLETAANTWKITKDTALKTQMDRIAATLISTQLPDGYLGTYLPDTYWTEWDVWVHKYNLYGLLAYYSATGKQESLETAKKIGDLLCRTFGDNPGQLDIIKSGVHVGMAAASVLDPMAELYRWTGNRKYLDFCFYVISAYDHPGGPAILKTLAAGKPVNEVANAKAYEMLSNLVGIIKLYRLTGDQQLLSAAKWAFDDIAAKRLYVSGTASYHEYFQKDFELKADNDAHMGEGCVTTTWMQLNMELFAVTGDLRYFKEIEKSVYNQLLGAENPQTGCVSYYTPLMGTKPYGCNITCCLSSVPRGIALIPYLNYTKVNNIPAVLMYESTTVKDTILMKDGSVVPFQLKIDSRFPEQGSTTIQVKTSQPATFAIQLRIPEWCTGFKAKTGGKTYSGKNGQWVQINKRWNKDDKIEVSFEIPMHILPGGKSYPDAIAFKLGPQVLSADASLNPAITDNTPLLLPQAPDKKIQRSTVKLPAGWVGKQAFSLPVKTAAGKTETLILVPFAEAGQTGSKANVWIPVVKKTTVF